MFVSGIKRSELHDFTETLLKKKWSSTGIYWNIAAASLQSAVICGANRRDHIPLGGRYISAVSTIHICSWNKICCCWTGVFIVVSPAKYTKHVKYLSRCILETLLLVSTGNLISYLMKSRQFIYCLWEMLDLPEIWLPNYCISKDSFFSIINLTSW